MLFMAFHKNFQQGKKRCYLKGAYLAIARKFRRTLYFPWQPQKLIVEGSLQMVNLWFPWQLQNICEDKVDYFKCNQH